MRFAAIQLETVAVRRRLLPHPQPANVALDQRPIAAYNTTGAAHIDARATIVADLRLHKCNVSLVHHHDAVLVVVRHETLSHCDGRVVHHLQTAVIALRHPASDHLRATRAKRSHAVLTRLEVAVDEQRLHGSCNVQRIVAGALDANVLEHRAHVRPALDVQRLAEPSHVEEEILHCAAGGDAQNGRIRTRVHSHLVHAPLSTYENALVHVARLTHGVVNTSQEHDAIAVARSLDGVEQASETSRHVAGIPDEPVSPRALRLVVRPCRGIHNRTRKVR
mmetsp:Transcript_6101/g.13917  ORF Transcript_6101/g.13917 Transcript_6101/m.13917 type:complete len:278 (+) Transcript_6101:306-1139(+)